MKSIRHQGHIAEHPIAGNYSWNRASFAEGFASLPSGGTPPTDGWPLQDDVHEWETPTWGGGSPPAEEHEAESYYDENGWMACSHCGAYEDGDEDGEDTETDEEADPSTEEYQAYLGDMTGATYEGLRHDYLGGHDTC